MSFMRRWATHEAFRDLAIVVSRLACLMMMPQRDADPSATCLIDKLILIDEAFRQEAVDRLQRELEGLVCLVTTLDDSFRADPRVHSASVDVLSVTLGLGRECRNHVQAINLPRTAGVSQESLRSDSRIEETALPLAAK